jgi:3-dehydroquinate dehydratase / shikimate dehydrogenase
MRICETVMTSTLAGLRAARNAASAPERAGRIGLVELRLDGLMPGELDVAGALADRRLPVIVTCRPAWEGGGFNGTEAERLRVLLEAVRLGAEFVDIEMDAETRTSGAVSTLAGALDGRTRLVLSHHRFAPGVPKELAARMRVMRASAEALGAGCVTKIAVMAERPRDCATLRRLIAAEGMPARFIAIAMGPAGVLSRLLPAKFSTEWTYAGAAAPGQLSVQDVVGRYRIADATAATRVFGIAGAPLGHSASPAMHAAAFAAAGIDAVFVPVETSDASELLDIADALEFEGLSITAPLKSRVFGRPHVHVDADARAIGAINTLRRGADGWDGRNFDAPAFRAPLDALGVDLTSARAIVLGAGGAARSAVRELLSMGATVEISARDEAKAAALAGELGVATTSWPPAGRAAIVVNATPVGTAPRDRETPVPAGAVAAAVAYDLVYNPEETRFLADARAAGARTIGGLAMLVAQAGRQFEWWTGAEVDSDVFTRAAQEFIQ